ncbi:haloacid dehalogenase superfamily, subfamily IA, variant 3 with third motif having DD or ED/haloacid dehalogenase superfamily, subfamily IA, variant 1 with third motif having Dx(3-4)D or Dx(3-4)E [Caloramator fervidus]|uniref:Haloacid dehalogenase superfamily, subfamily IA, variant 3 with third motif having DD or ED/haloacid dehalogenase superfamily, subfamily IA, variant 1 with third motif having Dx(3-4)D or Dx(3-4)E n=1 Tax=Caloramator fervidus TaxID=29344 RepID=A0A1H5SPR5_9CLOT|nr:HAD family phosphatase [Caloramator fervidus]SEF51831.1 haloacid dehalogenase superfamily, subfamily IA, variant 3 with third motif having DD or ED/haloacid dehalogenase superfamily, subfamily IA, variant 1 with third motif having Dx(3-4)D or Dx(3-4)E [Caloramator fervidus]
MLENIKAVIFDLDGTLIDSLWVWKQVDVDYLKKHGIKPPKDLQKHIEGLSFVDTAIYFKEQFGIKDSIEDIMAEWHKMVSNYYSSVIEIKKGVKEFLQYLKSKKYKIGIATSNSIELVKAVLQRNRILEYFEVIVTTDEVSKSKTEPDVFLEAAKRLNVSPKECLVFEDTISGAIGAKKAGMKVIGVFDENGSCSPEEFKEYVEHIIDDFQCIVENYCK